MTVKAVVFDLDGTLLDTMISVPLAYVETIRDLGGPDITPQQLIAAWSLGPTPVVLEHFLGRAATRNDLECFDDHVATAAKSAQPFPGVPELLQALRQDGHLLAVFTSATHRLASLMLAGTGLTEHFAAVVTGDQVANPKPAPDGLLDTCRLLHVPASAAAYVGDAATDLHCARAAGAVPIHARWSPHTDTAPGFPHVAHHPGDLITLIGTTNIRQA